MNNNCLNLFFPFFNKLNFVILLFFSCCKICQTNFYAQEELVRRNDEVAQLTKAVSDLQVYLYQEREHVLKLSAENDKLRVHLFVYLFDFVCAFFIWHVISKVIGYIFS